MPKINSIISNLTKFLYFLTILYIVNCVYRKDVYKIFDKYTVLDTLSIFQQQLHKNQCTSNQGPNCYLLTGEQYLEEQEIVKSVIEDLNKEQTATNFSNILIKLSAIRNTFNSKNKGHKTEIFSVAPKIMMNLLLNFESFDPTTVTSDQFMPEEKVISFNVGYLKLTFKGTLRITQDRINGRGVKIDKNSPPNGAYGVVEKRGKENNVFY